jgi:hypothetical protein
MSITHNKLKIAVEQLASIVYSSEKTPSSDDAASLNELLNFYKGEQNILSTTLPDTQNTSLTLFDDGQIRTEVFIYNNDPSKVLSVYRDSAATELLYVLEPKDSVTFPTSFQQDIYIKASAPSLSVIAWEYLIITN